MAHGGLISLLGLAAKSLQHLPHYEGNTYQADSKEKHGAGLGVAIRVPLTILRGIW